MSRSSWLARVLQTKGSGVFDFLSPAESCGPTPSVETQSSWFASMGTARDPGKLISQRKSKTPDPFDLPSDDLRGSSILVAWEPLTKFAYRYRMLELRWMGPAASRTSRQTFDVIFDQFTSGWEGLG